MRPLYVVGTSRNVGKTTTCIGLIGALRERGLKVGYMKPLGQRVTTIRGNPYESDARLMLEGLHMESSVASLVVPLVPGRVEKDVMDLRVEELSGQILRSYQEVAARHDVVIIESMGHVAAGACLKLSSGDVAQLLNARVLLIGGGGIGSTIDDISLCATFLAARGADMTGAVVNKVWPEKYRRVLLATGKGLDNLGIRSFGTMPYEETLAFPSVSQIVEELGGEVLCGHKSLDIRIGRIQVGAMEPQHMVGYLKNRALVIIAGDRSDNILAILSVYMLDHSEERPVSGIILSGGFRPVGRVMSLLAESGIPAILCRGTTYDLAAKLHETVFKITPDDQERIAAAICLVSEYVDVDGLLKTLES